MSSIGNFLWLVCGGIVMAVAWWLAGILMVCTLVGLPWARACFVLGQLAFLPFGREAVSRHVLTGHRDLGTGPLGFLGNAVWFCLGGAWLAIGHTLLAVSCALTLIGIPFAVAHLKLAGLALAPIGKIVVLKHVDRAARAAEAEELVALYRNRSCPA